MAIRVIAHARRSTRGLTALVCSLGMLATLCPLALAQSNPSGSEQSRIEVSTPSELVAVANAVASGDTLAGKTVVLTQDIDLRSTGFSGIGSYDPDVKGKLHPFSGDFDGQGHTVTLDVNDEAHRAVGLIGYAIGVSDSAPVHVRNIKLVGSITSNAIKIGSAVAYGKWIALDDVSSDVAITAQNTGTSTAVGGLIGGCTIGEATTSTLSITGCSSRGPIIAKNGYVGGIIGYIADYDVEMRASYVTASVTGGRAAGALAGTLDYGHADYAPLVSLQYGYVASKVSSTNADARVGALFGNVHEYVDAWARTGLYDRELAGDLPIAGKGKTNAEDPFTPCTSADLKASAPRLNDALSKADKGPEQRYIAGASDVNSGYPILQREVVSKPGKDEGVAGKTAKTVRNGQKYQCGSGSTAAFYKVTAVATSSKSGTASYQRPVSPKKVKRVKVPSSVTIGGRAYRVTDIAPKAFAKCPKLTKVTMSANVRTVGSEACLEARKLRSFTVGKGVRHLGSGAFSGASKLKMLIVKSRYLKTRTSIKGSLKGSNVRTVRVRGLKKSDSKKVKEAFSKRKWAGKSLKVK